jgi:hypothetical protein
VISALSSVVFGKIELRNQGLEGKRAIQLTVSCLEVAIVYQLVFDSGWMLCLVFEDVGEMWSYGDFTYGGKST